MCDRTFTKLVWVEIWIYVLVVSFQAIEKIRNPTKELALRILLRFPDSSPNQNYGNRYHEEFGLISEAFNLLNLQLSFL